MNMKKLPLLAIILVVIVGIIVISNQLSNKQPSEKSLSFFPQFSEAECNSISICDSHDSVTLVRHGTAWFVTSGKKADAAQSPLLTSDTTQRNKSSDEYPADSASLQTVLEKIKSMKKDDLISQNVAKQADLEVDTVKGTRVDLVSDKGPASTFYIGKNGADWSSNFVRMKGSNDVYLVSGSVKYSFFAEKNRWKDKTIAKFDKAAVKSVSIVKKDTTIELALSAPSPTDSAAKAKWTLISPVKDSVKEPEVEKILNAMSNLNAMDFESNASLSEDSLGFSKPYCIVTASLDNGTKKTIVLGKQKSSDGTRWVRTPDKNATFLLSKYLIENIDRSINNLKGIEEKKPDTKPATLVKKKALGKKK